MEPITSTPERINITDAVMSVLSPDHSLSVEEIADAILMGHKAAFRVRHIEGILVDLYSRGRVARHWPSGTVGEGECRWVA